MTTIHDIVNEVDSLPPLPDTVVKLINVINDPKSTIEQIVTAVKYDQAVTGELLRLCNSAYYGVSRRITSISDALVALGNVKVLQMVMTVHANSLLTSGQRGYGLEPGVLWKHSVAVAIASSSLATRLRLPNANLLFTAGLLHDVGKTILNEHVADRFVEIVRRVKEDKLSFVEAEHNVLGFSHEEVGAMVAEKWKLPDDIVRCIRYHHNPGCLDPPDDLVDTVYLANCICLLLGVGLGEDGLWYRADETVMERHQLHEADLEITGAEMLVELQRVQQLFAHSSQVSGAPGG